MHYFFKDNNIKKKRKTKSKKKKNIRLLRYPTVGTAQFKSKYCTPTVQNQIFAVKMGIVNRDR